MLIYQGVIQDFPESTPTPKGHQSIILENFPANCIKMKKIGPRGRGGMQPIFYYVDPPLQSVPSDVTQHL